MNRQALRYLSIYGKLQMLHIRMHMEYPVDFWVGIIGGTLRHLAGFIFLGALLTTIPVVAGWNLWEVALLQALVIIPRGLVEVFCDGQMRLRHIVNKGDFDLLLVRPISPALLVVTQISNIHGLGTVLLGSAILYLVTVNLNLVWTMGNLLFLLVSLLSSFVILSSINFITNCIVFWDPAADSTFTFLVNNTTEFAKFPIDIYGRSMQLFLTWIVPIAFISYYPGIVLLGRVDSSWLSYLTPLAAIVTFLIACIVWRLSLINYQGVGH